MAELSLNAAEFSPWRLATERDFDRIVEMNERLNIEDPAKPRHSVRR
jgi:hypothetical protein